MMDNPKLKSALIGGGVFGVLAALPYISFLNGLCCALYIGGGVLAAYLYLKEAAPLAKTPYADGAVVGVLAGVVCGVVATVVGAIVAALGLIPSDASEAFAQLEQMGFELPAWVRDAAGADGVNATMISTQLVMNVILAGIFSMIGGLVGVAIFHKKDADQA